MRWQDTDCDIGHAVQEQCESMVPVIRNYLGHGIGRDVTTGFLIMGMLTLGHLKREQFLAIEPDDHKGSYGDRVLSNDWTVVTDDGLLAAHYENTMYLNEG